MAYDAILNTEIEVDDPLTQSLMQKIKDNFDFLLGASSGGSSEIPNGSFDIDSDSDNVPDLWTIGTYPGGDARRVTVVQAQGSASFRTVHPGGAGNGGGFAESDFLAIGPQTPFMISFLNSNSQSGVKVQVIIRYFSALKADLSLDDTAYSETVNPVAGFLRQYSRASVPPVTAFFMKVKLVGGFTDTDPGSSTTTYFDNILIDYNVYTSNGASLGDFKVYDEGGDNASVLARSGTVGATPTKVAEANILYPGEIDVRIYVDDDGGTGKARVYVNGAAVGTEHTFTTPSSFEDLAIAVEVGDLLQVYGYGTVGDGMTLHHITVHSVKRAPVIGGFEYLNP